MNKNMVGLDCKKFREFEIECAKLDTKKVSEISEEILQNAENYAKLGQNGLNIMTEAALIACRPNHAQVWELLKDLMGDHENIKKIRTFLETLIRKKDTPTTITINIKGLDNDN